MFAYRVNVDYVAPVVAQSYVVLKLTGYDTRLAARATVKINY